MENYNEQYTNNKRRQRIESEMVTYCLTWWLHWTPPTLKHHYWTLMHLQTLFKSFNNKNTTTGKTKRQRTNTKRKKKIGNNILVGYSWLDTKMEKLSRTIYTKKRREKIEVEMVTYCFPCRLDWTPPTLKHHYWTLMQN